MVGEEEVEERGEEGGQPVVRRPAVGRFGRRAHFLRDDKRYCTVREEEREFEPPSDVKPPRYINLSSVFAACGHRRLY